MNRYSMLNIVITEMRWALRILITMVFFAVLVVLGLDTRSTSFFVILYRRLKVNVFENLVLMEHKYMGPKLTQAEGFVLGVGAKMFTIAGPVIVYGVSASVVYGLIYWITTLF